MTSNFKGLKRLPENILGRDFFVGDLHGERADLDAALRRLGFDFDHDRLIAVGDLIDRGPDSPGCLELLQQSWFHSCLGNHEAMLIAWARDGDMSYRELQSKNGGQWLEGLAKATLQHYCDLILEHCWLAIETRFGSQVVGAIHSEVSGNDWQFLHRNPSRSEIQRSIWSRERFRNCLLQADAVPLIHNVDVVVSGHNPHPVPLKAANQFYIDTRQAGRPLTVLSTEELLIMAA